MSQVATPNFNDLFSSGPVQNQAQSGSFTPTTNPFFGARFGGKPFNFSNPSRLSSRNRGSAIDQLSAALQRDVGQTQAAADRQFGRIQGQIGKTEELLGGIDERLTGVAQSTSEDLLGLGEELGERGDAALGRFDAFAGAVQGQTDTDTESLIGDVDAATARTRESADALSGRIGERADQVSLDVAGFAQDAVQSAKDAIFDTQELANRQMSAAITGLEARTRQDSARIRAGLRADGTQMTPEEQRAAQRDLQASTNVALSQVTTSLASQAKTLFAQLKTNLAQTQVQAGELTLGAGAQQLQAGQIQAGLEELKSSTEIAAAAEKGRAFGRRAEVGVALSSQRVAVEQIAQGFQAMRADLAKVSATILNAAKSQAISLELQGRFGIAEMIRNNPETVVGMFSGLAAMLAAASAPGAANIPAFDFGGRRTSF